MAGGAAAAGRHPPAGRSDGARGPGVGGRCGTLRNLPGSSPPVKPPEAPPTPVPQFPLRVGTGRPVSAEAADPYVKALWELKRRSPPRNSCHCCKDRGGRGFARSGLALLGKGGDPEAWAQTGNPHHGKWTPRQAPAFCPHSLSQLCAAGTGTRPRWLGVRRIPWHLPGRPFVPQPVRTPAHLRWLGWEGQHSRGTRCPCPKSFSAHLVCCQDDETHVMWQSDPQLPVISSRCVSFMQKFERVG